MRPKNLDLMITMAIAAMNIVWVLLPSHSSVIGIILALPLVFVLPGYTLTEAFFHKRSLDISHRLLLSLGLSLAIDILSGFILNMLSGGLQALSWALFLGLLAVVLSLLVAYLRRGSPLNEAQSLRLPFTAYTYILFALATIVAIFAVLYSISSTTQQPHAGFTQLWILPAVPAGKSCAVRLGVRNFELTSVTYRITMTTNGTQVASWSLVALAPQQEWSRLVPIIIPKSTADSFRIDVQLYRLDKPRTVYRKVDLTLYRVKRSTGGTMQQCTTSPQLAPSAQSAPTRSFPLKQHISTFSVFKEAFLHEQIIGRSAITALCPYCAL